MKEIDVNKCKFLTFSRVERGEFYFQFEWSGKEKFFFFFFFPNEVYYCLAWFGDMIIMLGCLIGSCSHRVGRRQWFVEH